MSKAITITDGGPAFPGEFTNDTERNVFVSGVRVPSGETVHLPGMSYRDWLAGQIVAGIVANREYIAQCTKYNSDATLERGDTVEDRKRAQRGKVSEEAWAIADAMLAARNGGGK